MFQRLFLSILVLSVFVGCGTGTSGTDSNSGLGIVVDDQKISLYSRLKIKEIETDKNIFLVIHNSFIDGSLNRVLLAKQYQAGLFVDEEIVLDLPLIIGQAASYGDLFHAVLYIDTDANNEFDITLDEIALNRSGQSISQSFKVSDSDDTAHVELKIDAEQGVAFTWTEVADDLDGFSMDADNTDGIILTNGYRYKMHNIVAESYGLRFLDQDGGVVVELSKGVAESIVTVDDLFIENVVAYDGGEGSGIQGSVSYQ